MAPRLPDSRVDDPPPDDWLAQQGDVDWGDEPSAGHSPHGRGGELASTALAGGDDDLPESRGRAIATSDARRRAVVRRRAIGLVALLALALVGVGVGVTIFRSDEPTAPTTAASVATPPPPSAEPPATTTPLPEETPAPLTITLPSNGTLALGDSGEEVETLQTALAALQLDPGEADGFFGERTQEAVLAFQRANDLPADGIVGPSTARELNAMLADQGVTG